ncbi:PREDICTED: DC-STAMP domain-containing protein 2 isoform X2 [Poecilia mexicana]|uniref:DC-STAMP domain-containing protein 2 isoform X2 n=1 Tax=Poecilia mexicana TaxID=48701 RepID=UPI00072EAD76|nr:PREDICTED: DC-STAMP domain-containing protein 2 isoform X2 [Poecilia mexicana]
MATGFSWSAGAKESEIKKMGPEEEKRHLLNRDIAVQVVKGGATQTLGRSLNRSGGRARRRRKKLGPQLVQAGRSLLAFLFGLLLVFIHGLLGFLVHKQPLQFCVISTLILAGLTAFGMGLSIGFRANVMVMLPTLFSARVVLFLYVSVVVSGPMKNTVENTERAAASLLCSADLAANQTKELMQRAATPLFSAIDEIRKISRNAYAVAGRVQNFINTLTDSVRHVARTLRNVLHFLVDIGDICNDKMGAPYRKCRDLFAQGRTDCNNLLKEFNFLCEIVDAFLPLCNLARAGELFCIIPSYVAAHLKQRLVEPTVAAFRKMMREFDFNLSSTVSFDVDANASRTLQQVSQQIMADISADLQNFQRLSQLLAYTNFVLLGLSFIGALMYQRRYLRDLHFDNFYISAQFRQLDQQVASEGGASVLPLTRRETQTYVTPLSLRLTQRERRRVLVRMASVFRHLVGGGLIVAMDFLVFWILDQVHHQVEVDVVARAPYQVAVQVNGSGYASDIFRDLVASFNVFQTGNITVISRKCLVEPKEPDHRISFLLGFLLGMALVISLFRGFVQRLRRIVCAFYYPDQEQERIRFLHQHILSERLSVGRALRRSAVRHLADRAAGASWMQALLRRLPGGGHLSSLTCLGCNEAVRQKEAAVCDVSGCSGSFVKTYFHQLPVLPGSDPEPHGSDPDPPVPLRDSSDDEQLTLWSAARLPARLPARSEMQSRTLPARGSLVQDDSSDFGIVHSEADVAYQDRSGSSDSDSDSDSSEALSEISVQTPGRHGNQQSSVAIN